MSGARQSIQDCLRCQGSGHAIAWRLGEKGKIETQSASTDDVNAISHTTIAIKNGTTHSHSRRRVSPVRGSREVSSSLNMS